MVTCLVCCGPLVQTEGDQWRCPTCNYWYPLALLASEDFNLEVWERIQREHLACVVCETDPPGMPKVWSKDGKLIRCPVHAKRVGWRRWFRLGFSKRSRNTTPVD